MYVANRTTANPRIDTLLSKVQYCDFALALAIQPPGIPGPNVDATYVFSRFDFEGIVQSVYGINSTPLWPRVSPLFEEYAVKGFRFEYIPSNLRGVGPIPPNVVGSSASGGLGNARIYEDLNTYNIAGYTDN